MHQHGGNMENQTGNKDLIWYVAYGSNLSSRRFKRYLDQMPGQPPIPESKAFSIPNNIYFDRESSTWGGGGVAFLDPTKEGFAYGRAYLLTHVQFHILQDKEAWYPVVVHLGTFEGRPAMTFTQAYHNHRRPPNDPYLDEIILGLQETYPELTWSKCNEYLLNSVKGEKVKI